MANDNYVWERVDTGNGILSVCAFVSTFPRRRQPISLTAISDVIVAGYDVFLPSRGAGWDYTDIVYALWLCKNPSDFVKLNYTVKDCYCLLGGNPFAPYDTDTYLPEL